MLPARPNRLVARWFDGWCRRALRRSFHAAHLYLPDGGAAWDDADPSAGRLYIANHASFWDGVLLYWLLRRRLGTAGRRRVYAMVDAEQVAEHPFFRRCGAFSVDRSDARDGLAAVAYAADRLAEGAAVVIFPQGAIAPADRRPLGFEGGLGRIVARCPSAAVVPVGLRYEFWLEQRPEAMVAVGRALRFGNLRADAGRPPRRRRVVRVGGGVAGSTTSPTPAAITAPATACCCAAGGRSAGGRTPSGRGRDG